MRPSAVALVALVALAAASPWTFGAVQPAAHRVVSTLALAACVLAAVLAVLQKEAPLPAVPIVPMLGFLAVVAFQLVPLPAGLHRWLARGSYEVWHPPDPAAVAVLGDGFHPISIDPDTTLRSLAWLAGLMMLATLAAAERGTHRGMRRAALVVAGNGLALAIFAIWARGHLGARLYGRYAVPTTAPFGPFVSKNHFAGYVAMAALLTLGLLIGLTDRRESRGRSWATGARAGAVVFALVAAAAMALSVLVSSSRGGAAGLLGGAIAFAGLAFGSTPSRRRLLVPAMVAIAIVAVVIVVLPEQARQRLRNATGASFRIGVWRETLHLAAGSPLLGSGLGSFHDAFPRVKAANGEQRIEHAENEYVELLAETGLLGFGFAAAAAGLLVARILFERRQGATATHGLAAGALSALAALAVHNALDFDLRIPSNAALAALAAALGAGALRLRPLSTRAAIAAGVVALALLVAVNRLPPSPSTVARERVREAGASPTSEVLALRLDRADAALRIALRRRPAEAEAWLQLAAVNAVRGDAATAAALASHALSLDPQRGDLGAQARALAR
jgi:O-antigen ligase